MQLLSTVNCWLKCMMLDPYNQTDNAECKSRPDSGLSAITELDPGYITGECLNILLPHISAFTVDCWRKIFKTVMGKA